jgi:hypothetical protein
MIKYLKLIDDGDGWFVGVCWTDNSLVSLSILLTRAFNIFWFKDCLLDSNCSQFSLDQIEMLKVNGRVKLYEPQDAFYGDEEFDYEFLFDASIKDLIKVIDDWVAICSRKEYPKEIIIRRTNEEIVLEPRFIKQ